MKLTNIFKLAVVSSILVFAVGCGKDNKSGGYGYNMQYSNNLSQAGVQAHTQFKQWYESPDTGVQAGSYIVRRAKTGYQSGGASLPPGCERKEVKIFGMVVGYTIVCKNGSGSSTSENIRECGVQIIANNNGGNSLKINNPILRKIYSGGYGILVDGTSYNGVINLVFQQSNGQMTAFAIDTQYNGAFQPAAIQDSTGIDQIIPHPQYAGFQGTNLPACF